MMDDSDGMDTWFGSDSDAGIDWVQDAMEV